VPHVNEVVQLGLDPYLVLRLLAENPRNLDRDLVWGHADLVESGWIREEDAYEGVPDDERIDRTMTSPRMEPFKGLA
jgi:hypothetical protein